MTPQEINEAVARKLGRTVKCGCDCLAPVDQPDNEWTHTIHYSTDIRAAWDIVEDLRAKKIIVEIGVWKEKVRCVIHVPGPRINEEADTAPLAICNAFLKIP